MCVELRLLRTGILRAWRAACAPGAEAVDEILRLDDAFDEALAEAVSVLEAQHEDARNLLLGALGHDLRNPLNAIHATAAWLDLLPAGDDVANAARRLKNSSLRMKALLDDLLDYNRATLGGGLHVEPAPIDLAQAAEEELQQLRTAHPGRAIELTAEGDTRGHWDPNRMQQLLGNLVSNAIKYGDAAPVRVHVAGRDDGALLEVRNRGPGMTHAELARIFEPLRRGSTSQARPESTSLGLGLYIAREIVRAHDGRIEARHALGETVFAVSLPRRASAAPAP
jgi:signal transduction histidine kinase